jgi:hypothetical protein
VEECDQFVLTLIEGNGNELRMTARPTDLTEALEVLERFLRGAGYIFHGNLRISNDYDHD